MRSAVFNVCVGLTAGLLLVAARPAEAISVDIQGMPATVTAGQNFSVDVVISGIVDEIITAWDIDVAFNTPLLSNTSQTWFLAMVGGGDALTDGAFLPGMADMWLVSLLSDADLASVHRPLGEDGERGKSFSCGTHGVLPSVRCFHPPPRGGN